MSKKIKLSDHFNKQTPKKESIHITKNQYVLDPECEILINKQKRKVYGKKKNKIYLNDNDNIQIYIFNPLTERIGVQIEFNGHLEEKMLIVNPGQKVMLDRFIDSKRKIKYSTYFVDGSDNRTKKAIKKNGDIKINFWKEKINFNNYTYIDNYSSNNIFNDGTSGISPTYDDKTYNYVESTFTNSSLLETGRMEKGNKSNQKMKKIEFDPYYIFYTKKYKLLPFSQMKKKKSHTIT